MAVFINKNYPAAVLQIVEDIRKQIANKEYSVGDPLRLSMVRRAYGVSRVTVRKGLTACCDGPISRTRGKGPVVSSPKIAVNSVG